MRANHRHPLKTHAMRDIINDMNTQEELIQLKENIGLSWKKLSDYYGIPYRTMQDWYMGKRRMPEYLLRLMIYKYEMEKSVSVDENGFTPTERKELRRRIETLRPDIPGDIG